MLVRGSGAVLVTGSGRGIGRATAIVAAEAGFSVAVNYLQDQKAAEETADVIREKGGRAGVYQADVRDSPAVREMVRRVEADLGDIEGLVNNAGTLTRRTTHDTTREDWDSVLSTCLTGPFICVQAVLPGMVARKRGAIVNVASIAGLTGGIMGPHYAAAKGGLVNMTRYLARDLAVHNIRVNAVAPTLTETDMVKDILAEGALAPVVAKLPFGRLIQPTEVADVVVFLLTDRASYVSGECIRITGAS